MKDEQKYNYMMLETDDDRKRKSFSHNTTDDTNNTGNTYDSNKFRYLNDECRLLGLNPNNNITKNEVKNAYHKTIKKWHPDIAPVNTQTATEMCARINDAYKKILENIDD